MRLEGIGCRFSVLTSLVCTVSPGNYSYSFITLSTSYREGDRARREEYNRELKEMHDRVNKRPLLFEQQSQATARRAAERKYADILRSAGVEEALVRDLVTKDGKIVDVDSDDELEETGSQVNYSGSRRSSGAGYMRDSHDGNVDEDTSDVEEEIEEDEI